MDDGAFPKRPLSEEMYHFIAFLYALLALVAFFLNSLVIFTFIKDPSLLIPSNLLVLSISVADWLMAAIASPMGVAANASEAWALAGRSCVSYAFITTSLGFAAMLHHTVMALERFLVVTNPYMEEIQTRTMVAVITAVWAFSILWGVFPLLGWSSYVPEVGNSACSLHWHSSSKGDAIYIYAIFSLFFFLPTIIIVAAYSLMYRSVKWMSDNAVKMWGTNAGPTLEIITARAKSAKMFILMVTGFLIGWTPYAVISLYAVAGGASHISPALATVPAMFAKTTIVYNPIIYFFMYDRFKVSLRNSVRKIIHREVAPFSTNQVTA